MCMQCRRRWLLFQFYNVFSYFSQASRASRQEPRTTTATWSARAWAVPTAHAAASTRPAQARHARHWAPAPRAAHGLCPWVHFLAVAIGSFCRSIAGLLRGTDGTSMSGGEVSLCLMLVMLQPGRWLGDGRLCCPFLLLRKYWRAVAQCSLTRTSQRGVSHNGFEPGFSCPCKWNGNGCGHLYSTVLLQAIRMPVCPREGRKQGDGASYLTHQGLLFFSCIGCFVFQHHQVRYPQWQDPLLEQYLVCPHDLACHHLVPRAWIWG